MLGDVRRKRSRGLLFFNRGEEVQGSRQNLGILVTGMAYGDTMKYVIEY